MWPLLAMGALSALSAGASNKAQASAAKEAALDSIAQSQAAMEANQRNFQQSAFRVGLLNVQKAQQTRALQQQKFQAGAQEKAVLGTAVVNAAASGTIGASVDAVQTDIEMAFNNVRAQISDENETNAMNYNTALYDLVSQGTNQIITVPKFRAQSTGSGLGGMLLSGATSMASSYFTSKMDLGLGSTTGSKTTIGQDFSGLLSSLKGFL